jgi:hypothetical protein
MEGDRMKHQPVKYLPVLALAILMAMAAMVSAASVPADSSTVVNGQVNLNSAVTIQLNGASHTVSYVGNSHSSSDANAVQGVTLKVDGTLVPDISTGHSFQIAPDLWIMPSSIAEWGTKGSSLYDSSVTFTLTAVQPGTDSSASSGSQGPKTITPPSVSPIDSNKATSITTPPVNQGACPSGALCPTGSVPPDATKPDQTTPGSVQHWGGQWGPGQYKVRIGDTITFAINGKVWKVTPSEGGTCVVGGTTSTILSPSNPGQKVEPGNDLTATLPPAPGQATGSGSTPATNLGEATTPGSTSPNPGPSNPEQATSSGAILPNPLSTKTGQPAEPDYVQATAVPTNTGQASSTSGNTNVNSLPTNQRQATDSELHSTTQVSSNPGQAAGSESSSTTNSGNPIGAVPISCTVSGASGQNAVVFLINNDRTPLLSPGQSYTTPDGLTLTVRDVVSEPDGIAIVFAISGANGSDGTAAQNSGAENGDSSAIHPNPVACTQEAKQCPDGTYVARTGPNCEFSACPNAPSNGTTSQPLALQCTTGCVADSRCLPFGTRVADGNATYCDLSGQFSVQKADSSACQNNYECVSNQCYNAVCVSLEKQVQESNSLLQKIFAWLSKAFG